MAADRDEVTVGEALAAGQAAVDADAGAAERFQGPPAAAVALHAGVALAAMESERARRDERIGDHEVAVGHDFAGVDAAHATGEPHAAGRMLRDGGQRVESHGACPGVAASMWSANFGKRESRTVSSSRMTS